MKVLSNLPVIPSWQKVEQAQPQPPTTTGEFLQDLGHPVSVLPDVVQESLRSGQRVDPGDIVPVPTR